MRLSGRLFKLKRDINLVSNVLDVPELFWAEASLGELYGGVREYLEISERVEELNRKLEVVRDLVRPLSSPLPFLTSIYEAGSNTRTS